MYDGWFAVKLGAIETIGRVVGERYGEVWFEGWDRSGEVVWGGEEEQGFLVGVGHVWSGAGVNAPACFDFSSVAFV